MIVLYEHPLSPFAQKVKMALYEKGVEFELRLPDLFGGGDEGFNSANRMMRSGGADIVLDGMKKNNIRFSHALG